MGRERILSKKSFAAIAKLKRRGKSVRFIKKLFALTGVSVGQGTIAEVPADGSIPVRKKRGRPPKTSSREARHLRLDVFRKKAKTAKAPHAKVWQKCHIARPAEPYKKIKQFAGGCQENMGD